MTVSTVSYFKSVSKYFYNYIFILFQKTSGYEPASEATLCLQLRAARIIVFYQSSFFTSVKFNFRQM